MLPAGVAAGVMHLKKQRLRVAVYTRFSTKGQRSTADQIRVCREWAEFNGMAVDDDLIFSDEGISGRVEDRPGLNRLKAAVLKGDVDVVLFFATSRLFRKTYKALMFVEETLMNRGVRVVFTSQGIDSADEEYFDEQLQFATLMDQHTAKHGPKGVRAAQVSKALLNEVWGSRTFGYARKAKPGMTTRRGLPTQINIVCPRESEWVKRIFSWFVFEKMSYGEICRRFNQDPDRPKLPQTSRLTVRNLKAILANRRYIGDWSYGWQTNDWRGRKNGPKQKKLEEPQRRIDAQELRIIDDETFKAAQARMANMPGAGGRRAWKHDPDAPKHPLSGLMHCPNPDHGKVWANNGQFWCVKCYNDHEQHGVPRALYSGIGKDVALLAICRAVGYTLGKNRTLVEAIVDAAVAAAEKAIVANRSPLEKLGRQIEQITGKIQFNQDNPGDTLKDQAETQAKLAAFRAERAKLEHDRETMKKAMSMPTTLPTAAEIGQVIVDLQKLLGKAGKSADNDVWRAIRIFLHDLIDGPIMLSQQGKHRPGLGWLRAKFTLHFDRLEPRRPITGVPPVEVEVDLLRPNNVLYAADEIIRLHKDKVPLKKIARIVKVPRDKVVQFVKDYYAKDGLMTSYVLDRPWLPRSFTGGKSKYELMKDEFKKLADEGWLYQEIADHYGIDIHMIRIGIKAWYEERGLPVPDGRTRRKSLKRKNRPKPPQEPPAAA